MSQSAMDGGVVASDRDQRAPLTKTTATVSIMG